MKQKPDAYIVPTKPFRDKNLKKIDPWILGILYQMQEPESEKCLLKNEEVAQLLNCSLRTVQSSLKRLEANGYIKKRIIGGNKREITIKKEKLF